MAACRAAPWLLLLSLASPAEAQGPAVATPAPAAHPAFFVFADTAGISTFVTLEDSAGAKVPTAHPGIYITWVQARATATSLPSSAVLVAWDCARHQVKRLAQIVYQLRPDSLGVQGSPSEVDRDWQAPTNPGLFDLVCRVGPTHSPAVVAPTVPKPPVPASPAPQSPYPES
jgi:hypothetical protein